MVHSLRMILLGMAAVAATAGPGWADAKSKRAIAKLFAPTVVKANDSVVRVRVDGKDVALGTVVDKDGHIITKGSELKGKEFSIRLRDGTEYEARYLGYHEKSDLGLLKADAAVKPIQFADVKKVEVGNFIAAPGLDDEPLAVGVISVNSRRLFGVEGVIENSNRGYLGVQLADAPDSEGALVSGFPEEGRSAAKEAKILKGDIIIRIDGKTIKNRDDVMKYMQNFKPNDQVEITVLREDEEKVFKVKLMPKSAMDRGDMQNRMGGALSNRRTGFPEIIQHDMVLKPTDCGGPIVDLEGNVLGINIARAGRVETWALPPDLVKSVTKELIDGKHPLKNASSESDKPNGKDKK